MRLHGFFDLRLVVFVVFVLGSLAPGLNGCNTRKHAP